MEDNDDKQVQVKPQMVNAPPVANPMLLVKSKDMPTKLEFAQDQDKDKPKGE